MTRCDEPIGPMMLGNMRSLGVRSLFATCLACGSSGTVVHPAHAVHAVRQSRRQCDTELDRAGQQLAGDAAMSLTAEQRGALTMLATAGLNGAPQALLSAHGFDASLIAGLVDRGLATLTAKRSGQA